MKKEVYSKLFCVISGLLLGLLCVAFSSIVKILLGIFVLFCWFLIIAAIVWSEGYKKGWRESSESA